MLYGTCFKNIFPTPKKNATNIFQKTIQAIIGFGPKYRATYSCYVLYFDHISKSCFYCHIQILRPNSYVAFMRHNTQGNAKLVITTSKFFLLYNVTCISIMYTHIPLEHGQKHVVTAWYVCRWNALERKKRSRGDTKQYIKELFTQWTMKLFQGLVKHVIGCRIHIGTTLVYTEGKKNVKVTMEFEVSQKHIWRLHCPLTWSNGFCARRGKRGAMVDKGKGPCQRKVVV